MSDSSDIQADRTQPVEDEPETTAERNEPAGAEESERVDSEARERGESSEDDAERTGVLGDPLNENIGEDTGLIE